MAHTQRITKALLMLSIDWHLQLSTRSHTLVAQDAKGVWSGPTSDPRDNILRSSSKDLPSSHSSCTSLGRWFFFLCQINGIWITMETHLWRSQRECFQIDLTEQGRLTLNEGSAIPRLNRKEMGLIGIHLSLLL